MTIIHRSAEDDFTGLVELCNKTPDAFLLLTGKLSKEQFLTVQQLAPHVRWKISKLSYDEAVKEINEQRN